MAQVKDNIITQNLSGKLGRQIVFKSYAYGTVVSKYPDMSKVVKSSKQLERQNRFKEAVAYARSIMADPEKKAAYEAELQQGKTVYQTAISEYMKKISSYIPLDLEFAK